MRLMSKGERISQFVSGLAEGADEASPNDIAGNSYYRGYFRCWNAQQYYEAHDVLEHLWLRTNSDDSQYFKGLIQAAGAFVHLQKQFEHPTHPKHGRRLAPAVRLFRLAIGNLEPFAPRRHGFGVAKFLQLLHAHESAIVESDYKVNPWAPERAPQLLLR